MDASWVFKPLSPNRNSLLRFSKNSYVNTNAFCSETHMKRNLHMLGYYSCQMFMSLFSFATTNHLLETSTRQCHLSPSGHHWHAIRAGYLGLLKSEKYISASRCHWMPPLLLYWRRTPSSLLSGLLHAAFSPPIWM